MNKILLKDIAQITMGQSPDSKFVSFEKIGLPLLNGPAEFTERYPVPLQYSSQFKRVANLNDILFCVRGSTTGRMNIADQKYAIGRGLASISHRVNPSLTPYIKALIDVNLKKLLGGTSGSVFPNITKDNLLELECYVHKDNDQEKIASFLYKLDRKMELNNKINSELEQMAKTLYNYWFVQFDFPNEKGQPYRSSGGKMIYDKVLKRELPEGWDFSVFSDWIKDIKAGDWGKETKEGNYTERVYCVRGADINGLNGKGEVKAPQRFILKNNLTKVLKPNDFIIEISGGSPIQSTGRIALLTNKTFGRFDTGVICSNFCKAISLKNEKYIFNFLQEWRRLYDAGVLFGYEGKTSGIKNFLFDSFVDSYNVILPRTEIVEQYYDIVEQLEKKRQINLQQNQELAQLRDWLLPMLMNGQIKVGDNYNIDNSEILVAAEPDICYGSIEPLDIPSNRKGFARQVLAGKVVSVFKDDPNFSNIKFQKVQFLAENLIGIDLNQNYYYQAAGPYDNAFMKSIYNHFKTQKWFDSQNQRFVPLTKAEKIEEYYQGYFGTMQDSLDKLFGLLYQTTEAEAEIIATIYAVWNNRIIEDTSISDGELIEDFYKWSDRKQQYTIEQIMIGLKWLRDNNLEPKGFGKLIKKAKGK
ncbi:restriction endonuclease subunit S [Sphingobacterium tabacisoli]|uniref:Restriction endonuclease subunit S n=1 Tax=Sphingobacterium tabacisoli TaxID=2044855 RepID=A0ABW5L609_9SPHI|nr:restriction endonuclease subunit S [Sphingobacterium tabacisoli]